MTLKSRKKNELWQYFLPPIITAVVLLIILAVKGVYPFGELSLVTYDMGYGDVPSLIYLNDAIHGETGLIFNWRILCGTGNSIFGAFLDPINVFIALFPREQMLNFASYWIILKMAAVAACVFPFFKKTFPSLPYYFQLIFTFLYTFGSFTIRYYQNPGFLNYAALLPLLVLAVFKLFNEKKYLPFILCLSYILITSVYFAFFFVLFLIIIGGFYIYAFYDKKNRGKQAFRLGVGTGCSLLISASSFIPALGSLLGGTRFENATTRGVAATAAASSAVSSTVNFSETMTAFQKIKAVFIANNNFDFNKLFMLAGLEFAAVILFILLFKIKKDKKHILFFVLSATVFVLPIIFENINLVWHGGSYNGYAMRYGFMLIFIFLCGAAYYLTRFDSLRDGEEKNIIFKYLKPVSAAVFAIIAAALYTVNMQNGAMKDVFSYSSDSWGKSLIKTYLAFFVAIAVVYLIIFTVKNKKFRRVLLSATMCAVLIANSFCLFASSTTKKDDCHVSYLADSLAVSNEISDENSFKRVSNIDSLMFINYAYAMGRSSVVGWSHSISPDVKRSYAELGYSNNYTLIFDAGASPFICSLFGANEYVTKSELNEKLYSLNKNLSGDYHLSDAVYSLPFGVLFDGSLENVECGTNTFVYQNDIAKLIIGVNGDLYEKASCKVDSYEKNVELNSIFENSTGNVKAVMPAKKYTFSLNENQVLYMAYNDIDGFVADSTGFGSFSLSVNGESVIMPGYDDDSNTSYPSASNNGAICLSNGEAGKYIVEVESLTKNADFSKLVFYTMDISALSDICASAQSAVTAYSTGKSSASITLDGTKSGLMFIPLQYSDNWECEIDSEKTELKKVLGAFTAVEIKEGQTNVELKYVPKATIKSAGLFFAAVILVLLGFFIVKKKKLEPGKVLYTLSKIAFAAVVALTLIVVYVIPLIAQVYMVFT